VSRRLVVIGGDAAGMSAAYGVPECRPCRWPAALDDRQRGV